MADDLGYKELKITPGHLKCSNFRIRKLILRCQPARADSSVFLMALPPDTARQAIFIAYTGQIAVSTFSRIAAGATDPFEGPETD